MAALKKTIPHPQGENGRKQRRTEHFCSLFDSDKKPLYEDILQHNVILSLFILKNIIQFNSVMLSLSKIII